MDVKKYYFVQCKIKIHPFFYFLNIVTQFGDIHTVTIMNVEVIFIFIPNVAKPICMRRL